jgi:hypothetical protein
MLSSIRVLRGSGGAFRLHRDLLLASTLLLAGCSALGGSDETTGEVVETVSPAMRACQHAGECSLKVPLVNGVMSPDITLVAGKDLSIGEGASVVDATGNPMPVINGGDGRTTIGTRARVGKIVSFAPTVVGNGAVVTGDVVSTGDISSHGGTISGQVLANQNLGAPGSITWPVLYPQASGGNVEVKTGTTELAPGRFDRVRVRKPGALQLTTGTYYLDRLEVDQGASLTLDNSAGMIVVYMRDRMSIEGAFSETGAQGDILFGYLGTHDVNVSTTNFRGTIIASDAKLHLGSPSGSIAGLFVGKSIDIDRGTQVALLAPVGTGPAAEAITAASVVTTPTGTSTVPMPTFWGDTPEEWAQIFGDYLKALIESGYRGAPITAPTPSFGLSSSLTIPTPGPASVISGPGGLQPLDADIGGGIVLGPDDGPGPSPNNVHFQFPSDGPFFAGNDAFGGGFFVSGDLDANQIRQAGFYTHFKTTAELKGRLFGLDFDAARAIVWSDTETEHANPDGTSTPRVEAGIQVFIGPLKVVDKSVDKIGLLPEDQQKIVDEEASLLPDGVPPPIPIAGFITLQPGAKGHFTITLAVDLRADGPVGTLTPAVGVAGTADVGLNLILAKAVVELSLTLIEVKLPVDLALHWDVNETPDPHPGVEACSANISWDAGFRVVWTTLRGEIRLKVSLGFDFGFWDAQEEILNTKIVSFDIVPEVSTPRVSIVPDSIQGLKSFKLDPEQCRFGGIICAKAGIPAFTLGTWNQHEIRDTSDTVGANYGQAACKDQYLFELGLSERPGVFMSGTWSSRLPADACNQYTGVLTLYGQIPSTGKWEFVDQIRTKGELVSGVCTIVVESRDNPQNMPPGADLSAPQSIVPPNKYSNMRAAVFAGQNDQKVPALIDWFWPTP